MKKYDAVVNFFRSDGFEALAHVISTVAEGNSAEEAKANLEQSIIKGNPDAPEHWRSFYVWEISEDDVVLES